MKYTGLDEIQIS